MSRPQAETIWQWMEIVPMHWHQYVWISGAFISPLRTFEGAYCENQYWNISIHKHSKCIWRSLYKLEHKVMVGSWNQGLRERFESWWNLGNSFRLCNINGTIDKPEPGEVVLPRLSRQNWKGETGDDDDYNWRLSMFSSYNEGWALYANFVRTFFGELHFIVRYKPLLWASVDHYCKKWGSANI